MCVFDVSGACQVFNRCFVDRCGKRVGRRRDPRRVQKAQVIFQSLARIACT